MQGFWWQCTYEVMLFCYGFRLGIMHLNHRNTYFSYFKQAMNRNRQAMPPCLSMLSQKLWKICLKLLTKQSQLVWWCFGHDCVLRSQGDPSVPLLLGPIMHSVDGIMVQLLAMLAFWWTLLLNLPATIRMFKFLYWATSLLLRAKQVTADLYGLFFSLTESGSNYRERFIFLEVSLPLFYIGCLKLRICRQWFVVLAVLTNIFE